MDEYRIEPLLDADAVAAWLGFKPSTIRQWVKTGDIPFVKVGRATRFRREDIEGWIAPGKEASSAA
jgi:excisionase family DNA binding protein